MDWLILLFSFVGAASATGTVYYLELTRAVASTTARSLATSAEFDRHVALESAYAAEVTQLMRHILKYRRRLSPWDNRLFYVCVSRSRQPGPSWRKAISFFSDFSGLSALRVAARSVRRAGAPST